MSRTRPPHSDQLISSGLFARQISRGKEGIIFKEHSSDCNRDCYMRSMRRSVFCLCPRGWTPWTLRAYQARIHGHGHGQRGLASPHHSPTTSG